jgi:ATP-binding cassette subfamily B protein
MWRRRLLVRQTDQTDCGAAVLATLALHHGLPIGLEETRELTGTDRQGTTLLDLARAAEKIGFAAKPVRAAYEALPHLPLPAVAHVRNPDGRGHFVVLYQAGKSRVVTGNPARGVEKLSREEFCGRWSGNLLLCVPERLPAPGRHARRLGAGRRFLQLLRPHTGVLLEALFCALLMTLLGAATSYFVQHLVDYVLIRQERQLLNALGVGMVLVVLFRTLFGALRRYLLAHISRKVDLALVAGYARHLLRLPLRFFETRRVGEILSRLNDAGKVRDAVGSTVATAVVDGVLVLLLLGVLWLYDLPLALVATAFVPVLLLGAGLHHPAARRHSREAMERDSHLYAHLFEDTSGVATVKAFGAERSRGEEGEARLVRYTQASFALQMLGLSMGTLSTLVTGLAGVVVLWFGGHRVMSGTITVGQLLFFYTLLLYLLEPLERLSQLNMKFQDALVAVDRLYQILALAPEQGPDGKRAVFPGLRQGIELRDVSFRYNSRATVLDKISLEVPAGKTVAVVGESGCGKSTLLSLLMGFHSPTEGRLLVDGVDLRDLDLASLRGRVGLVSQDPFIFNGTVQENIALGRPEASLGEVIEAARAAGLDEFIAGLPDRYATAIGERGVNLSGGQRQRLAIARALLRRPEILLFDEATSHLDTATERAIQQSLRGALAGRTVVLVAHRLSTVKDADVIYVLHRGRIAESGSHRQLLARQGWYAGLWRAQTDEGEPAHAPHAGNGHATVPERRTP